MKCINNLSASFGLTNCYYKATIFIKDITKVQLYEISIS